MDIETLEKSSVVILKAGDLQEFAQKLVSGRPSPVPVTPTNTTPIPQAQALRDWNTTRQRLARLRRLGLIEALELNGRIFYRPEAYSEAMQILNRNKKPLM